MVLCELLQLLRNEGLPATNYRVHYAINSGYVPRPRRDGSGRYMFSDADIVGMRNYLKNIPRPGRKKQPESGPPCDGVENDGAN